MGSAARLWQAGLLSLAMAATAIAKAQHTTCAARPGDDAAITDTLRTMYAAAMANDRPKFDALIAPGFYMFDGGRRFDGDAIMDWVAGYHAQGQVYTWSVTKPDVHIHCDVAWITYTNVGSMRASADAPATQLSWLESAVLERKSGKWKLVFFESTRVPASAPPSD